MSVCPICGCRKSSVNLFEFKYFGECPICGFVNCDATFIDEIVAGNIEKHIASAIFRQLWDENRHKTKKVFKAKELLDLVTLPMTPMDKINKILIYLFKKQSSMADYLPIDPIKMYPIAYSKDKDEMIEFLRFLLNDQLVKEKSNHQYYSPSWGNGIVQYSDFCLTVKGWEKADALIKGEIMEEKVFVAMWFDEEMKSVYDNAIKPAIEECGFISMRIDKKEHNNKIDDEMLEEIENCKFMVADFTGHRGGVYFEAGYAKALKKEVIFTCKATDSKEVHFDTNHFNHIFWEDEEDLKARLIKRITESIKR